LQGDISKPLVEARAGFGEFFAPDVVFEVFPNWLQSKGDRQDLKEAMEAAERARKTMSSQIYKIIHDMVEGHRVGMEVEWTGTLAVPFGAIPAGAT
jgi:hypothetical protein